MNGVERGKKERQMPVHEGKTNAHLRVHKRCKDKSSKAKKTVMKLQHSTTQI